MLKGIYIWKDFNFLLRSLRISKLKNHTYTYTSGLFFQKLYVGLYSCNLSLQSLFWNRDIYLHKIEILLTQLVNAFRATIPLYPLIYAKCFVWHTKFDTYKLNKICMFRFNYNWISWPFKGNFVFILSCQKILNLLIRNWFTRSCHRSWHPFPTPIN